MEGSYSITQSDIDAGSVYNRVTADGLPFSPSAVCVETEATAEHTLEIPQVSPNEAPVALCSDVTITAGSDCTAEASIDAGSHDPGDDEITLTQEPPGPYGLGMTPVTLTVSDGFLDDNCQATVTVRDEAAPFVSCNAPSSISPWEVPVSFTATGTDNCGLRRVLVRKPTCHRTGVLQTVDFCQVVASDDTLTVLNPGRSTEIRWLAKAVDQSGNRIERQCSVDVVTGLPPAGWQ